MRRAIFALLFVATSCGGSKPTGPNKPPDLTQGSGVPIAPIDTVSPPVDHPPPTPRLDDAQVIPLDPSIRKGVLPNGLTYYVKHQGKPEKRVQMWLAVNSGAVLENDDERGYSHLVEHIAFQGTKRFPKHDIKDFLERAGMQFGADLNAYTGFDETVYQLQVPTQDPATVDRGVDVLRDWSADISFDTQAVLDERKIIEEERRTRNSEGYRLLQQIIPVAFGGSKYASRLPIGTVEVIAAANADKLKKLYHAWYRPEHMAVIVVGDIDAAAMETELKQKFGDVPKAAADAVKRPTFPISTHFAPRFIVARDKEQAVVSVSIDNQLPHRPLNTVGDVRRYFVESMFQRLLDQRLATLTKRGGATWTGAAFEVGGFLRPVDVLTLTATAKDGKALDAIGALEAEIARVHQHGFSASELDEARASILQEMGEAAREVDTRDSREITEELVRNYLTNVAVGGPVKELELATAIIPTITNEQVVAVADKLGDDGRVVTIEAPMKGAVPTEAEVTAKIAEMSKKAIGEWQAVDLSQPLLGTDPTPGSVTGEKTASNDVTIWTLSNGATVYLKHTDFKKDEVAIRATSSGGASVVSDADYPQVKFAAAIVNASGFGNYGVEELAKKLAGKKVSIEVGIDADHESVAATASPDDLEPTLQLLHAAFTEPRNDQAAFDAWKGQQMMQAQMLGANAQAKFIIGSFDYYFQGNQRTPLPFPTAKSIEAIKLDKAIAQYKLRFANAADFSFIIVGNYDVAKLKPLVEHYIASLPAQKGKRETVQDDHVRARPGVVANTIKAGSEAKSMTLLIGQTNLPWTLAVEGDAKILNNVLALEMLDLLREKLGGTYSPNVQIEASRNPPQQVLSIVIWESDPARAKEMQEAAWKAIDGLATTEVKADTLAKVKEQIQKAHDASVLENEFWLESLARVARYGDKLEDLLAIDRVTSQVTAAHVKQIASSFLGKKNRATLTLLPEDAPKK